MDLKLTQPRSSGRLPARPSPVANFVVAAGDRLFYALAGLRNPHSAGGAHLWRSLGWPGDVYHQDAPLELTPIQEPDGAFGDLVALDVDEAKSSRFRSCTVADEVYPLRRDPGILKPLL